jgi:hypothetical protein
MSSVGQAGDTSNELTIASVPTMQAQVPRVLISYSHDSREHKRRVRGLADRLRQNGIDARIDQYDSDPPEGWVVWMRKQVQQADKVLLVFTEAYQRRFEGNEDEGKGLGVTYEGTIVTQYLYDSGGRNSKFRPLVSREEDERFISVDLRRFNRYRVDTQDNFEELLRWLHETPAVVAGPIGPKPHLPQTPTPELFQNELHEPQNFSDMPIDHLAGTSVVRAGSGSTSLPQTPLYVLRTIMTQRMDRTDVGAIWHTIVGRPMENDMVGRNQTDCVIALLEHTNNRGQFPQLLEAIKSQRPDLEVP